MTKIHVQVNVTEVLEIGEEVQLQGSDKESNYGDTIPFVNVIFAGMKPKGPCGQVTHEIVEPDYYTPARLTKVFPQLLKKGQKIGGVVIEEIEVPYFCLSYLVEIDTETLAPPNFPVQEKKGTYSHEPLVQVNTMDVLQPGETVTIIQTEKPLNTENTEPELQVIRNSSVDGRSRAIVAGQLSKMEGLSPSQLVSAYPVLKKKNGRIQAEVIRPIQSEIYYHSFMVQIISP